MVVLDDKQVYAVIPISSPSPVAFLNVFEVGDMWFKIKGCEACPLENRIKCCGNCPFILKNTGECKLHLEVNTQKPFNCVLHPSPDVCRSLCFLEWQCIQGSRKGQIHRQRDHGDVFLEGDK